MMEKNVKAMCRLRKDFWHLKYEYSDCFGQQVQATHTIQTMIEVAHGFLSKWKQNNSRYSHF